MAKPRVALSDLEASPSIAVSAVRSELRGREDRKAVKDPRGCEIPFQAKGFAWSQD